MSVFSGPQGKRAMRDHRRKLQDEAYARAVANQSGKCKADPVVFLSKSRRQQ